MPEPIAAPPLVALLGASTLLTVYGMPSAPKVKFSGANFTRA